MQFNRRLNEMICIKFFFFHFSDPHQKDDINKKAFDKFKKEHGVVPQADNATPSERFEGNENSVFLWVENVSHVCISCENIQDPGSHPAKFCN